MRSRGQLHAALDTCGSTRSESGLKLCPPSCPLPPHVVPTVPNLGSSRQVWALELQISGRHAALATRRQRAMHGEDKVHAWGQVGMHHAKAAGRSIRRRELCAVWRLSPLEGRDAGQDLALKQLE